LDALLSILLVMLPHLALVTHAPGLDGPVPLTVRNPRTRRENLDRLVTPLLAGFVARGDQ
ncbi:TetR/AcrR family transcriptional regulator, partial [Streptomyces sp. NPDC005534]